MWVIKWLLGIDNYVTDVTKIHNDFLKRQKIEQLRKDLVVSIKSYCDAVWAGPVFAEVAWKRVLTSLRDLDNAEGQINHIVADKFITTMPSIPIRR